MTTPHDDGEAVPMAPWRRPDDRRQRCATADTPPATTPGLVVTEERLPDGRRITYFGISR